MNDLIYVKYDTDHFTRISREGELYALNRDQLELITSILEDKNIPYYTSKVEFCTKIKWDKNADKPLEEYEGLIIRNRKKSQEDIIMDIKNDNQKGTIDNFLRTNGITLNPFCRLFGVSSNTFNLWKENKKMPTWFKQLAIDLGFDVSEFDVYKNARTDASKVHPKILELAVGQNERV
jgi:hypothetical protein|nr:MAG TPA: SOS-response transcriptional repressor [Caudoviricetes sp.]